MHAVYKEKNKPKNIKLFPKAFCSIDSFKQFEFFKKTWIATKELNKLILIVSHVEIKKKIISTYKTTKISLFDTTETSFYGSSTLTTFRLTCKILSTFGISSNIMVEDTPAKCVRSILLTNKTIVVYMPTMLQ